MTKTMTAEEVEKATRRLSEILEAHGLVKDHAGSAQNLVTVLAAQAARVPGLEAQVGDLADKAAATFTAATETRKRLEARAEKAESERDAARTDADTERGAQERIAARLWDIIEGATLDGGPDNDAERELLGLAARARQHDAAQEELTSLRDRVATLENELRVTRETSEARAFSLGQHEEKMLGVATKLVTAEARVRELEDAIRELDAHLDFGDPWGPGEMGVTDPSGINAAMWRLRDLLSGTSQPPPAPAQVDEDAALAEAERVYRQARAEGLAAQVAREHGVIAALALRTTTTPPPGLREAVEKEAKAARAGLLNALDLGFTEARSHAIAGHINAMEQAVRAAYDATGGDKVLCPGCKQMAPAEQMHTRCTLCAAHEDERARNAALEESPDAEDAAKYRAAVERAKDSVTMDHIYETTPGTVEDSWLAVASWLLALDTPPSGPGGGCKAHPGQQCDPETPGVYECRAVPASGRLLDAKPIQTSGPGGGEVPAPDDGEPLSAEEEALIDEAWKRHAAPDVVWEGNWMALRVYTDGTWDADMDEPASSVSTDAVDQLARALAEAKREVATLKAAAEGDLKSTADMHPADRANASLAWGCAGSIQTALRRERANRMEFARKAAESMRERAKAAILKQQATEEDGPTSDDNGYAFNMLLRLADEIGKLPLE